MATTWKAPTWRMPNEKNQSKFESYSLSLDGSNEYADLNSGVSMVLLPTNEPRPTSGGNVTLAISPKSYSCWFKVDTTGTKTIFSSAPTGGGYHVKLDVNSSNLLEFSLRTPSPTYTNTTGTTTIATDTWYHVLITVDGTNNKLYVNGTLEGTTACSGNMIYYRHTSSSNPKNLIGGYWTTSSTQDFDGSISDLVVFNYALSESQIASLYNSGSPINPMTLKPAPIAYYPLGGNASTGGDSSNTLSVPNVAVPDASVFDFDGSTPDFINCGNNSVFDFTTQITISAWVKTTDQDSINNIVKKDDGASNRGWNLSWRGSTGGGSRLVFWNWSTDGTYNYLYTTGTPASNFADGNWHHVIATYDGTADANGAKIYLDGVLMSQGAVSRAGTGLKITTEPVEIGDGISANISNVQLWNKELIASEVTTLYNSGVPLLTGTQPQEANLKAWYKLDQSANWEADTAGKWQIPDAVSSYPQSFNFLSTDNDVLCIDTTPETGPINSISQSITVSAWCKTTATTVYKYLVNRNRTTSAVFSNPWTLTKDNFYGGGGRMIWSVQNTNGDTIQVRLTGTNDPAGNPLITMNDGKWHHIVGVYNSSTNTCSLYTDGVLQGTATTAGFSDYPLPTAYPASRACIGGYNNGSLIPTYLNGGWDGEISNVQIWDKAFTNGNVTTLFNNGVPLTTDIETANLKGSFKLNNTEIFDGSTWSIENKAYPANYESALNFDATAALITIPDSSALRLVGTDFSISFWLQPKASGNQIIMDKYGPAAAGWGVYLQSGNLRFISFLPNNWQTMTSIQQGVWTHVLIVGDNTGQNLICYKNGIEVYNAAYALGVISNTTDLIVGTENSSGSLDYVGDLSNLVIWDSNQSSEKDNIYNSGTPTNSYTNTPVGWWKLDNVTTGIQDLAGSSNGVITGNVTKVNTFVSAVAGISKGMTEQNLVNNNVSVLNGESSGMDTSNLVTSTLTRQVPYNSYSLKFDAGNPDYIDFAAASTWTSGQTYTISMWMSKDSGGNIGGTALTWANGTLLNNIILWFANATTLTYNNGTNTNTVKKATISLNNNEWYHFCFTGTLPSASPSSSDGKFYLNGVEQALSSASSYISANQTTSAIGRLPNNAGFDYEGLMSNLALFESILTPTEVMKLYNSGVPGNLSNFNPSPTAWWSLGSDSYFNGASWIAPDLVGSNNGTSSGMDANALIGNAPNSTANGTSTNMAIDANLTGNAPNSSNNSFSVNMDYTDRETSVPS